MSDEPPSFPPTPAAAFTPPVPAPRTLDDEQDALPDDVEVSPTGEVEGVPVVAVAALAEDTAEAVAAGEPPTPRTRWWRPGSWSRSRRRFLRAPLRLWRSSLPLRVVTTTLVASIAVLLLGGFVLMQAASQGVVGTKQRNADAAASAAVQSAQVQLDAAALTPQIDPTTLLLELAADIGGQGNNGQLYDVILRGPSANYSGRADSALPDSIPADLQAAVTADPAGTYSRFTTVRYPGAPSVPGLVVGASLRVGADVVPVYFVFPLDQEVDTLKTLQGAVIIAGALLVVLLTLLAVSISRQVVAPVRAARLAAERLALGNLQDRMQVKGSDDFARLAVSMNDMAAELAKQISQLEELSAVQQRFVSDVSHELRTPLTTVRMAAEVLYEAREDFDPVSARSAELLQAEVDRFEALLTDLLEISRFDAGVAVLSTASVDLVDLVTRVVDAQAAFTASEHTEIRVHADGPAVVEADARRIERILRNLLVNAVEHGEGRPVDVLVAANVSAAAVAVRDHGVGFEAEQAKQVFHRFWRADPARARRIGGTGLGLSIAMEDARLHGGAIVAWGRPGQGTQFRLTLPRRIGISWEESPLPLAPRDLGPEPVAAPADPAPADPAPADPAPADPAPTPLEPEPAP